LLLVAFLLANAPNCHLSLVLAPAVQGDAVNCNKGHRELCPPDTNVRAAPGSSFGAHFLSASKTKSFCSTDLKLWGCLVHRLDLM